MEYVIYFVLFSKHILALTNIPVTALGTLQILFNSNYNPLKYIFININLYSTVEIENISRH